MGGENSNATPGDYWIAADTVSVHRRDTRRTDISLNVATLLNAEVDLALGFRRMLMRFLPVPLNVVVLEGLAEGAFEQLCQAAGLTEVCRPATVVAGDAVEVLQPVPSGNALVVVDYLADHARLRGINTQLRSKVPGGCVSYLSVLTVAESARNLADLRIFLSYGERGPETFTFRSALELMLPSVGSERSPWDMELELLQRLGVDQALPPEMDARRIWLEGASDERDGLFLAGSAGQLAVARDFVFLDTSRDLGAISQADVYTVVSNLIAAARCDNKGLTEQVRRDSPPLNWAQTVYGQVLLCPSNFRDFSDPVLRAAMLRAARPAELNYSVDEECSKEMLDVVLTDVSSWHQGRGDSLPEFMSSLACRRLRLMHSHEDILLRALRGADVPDYVKLLGQSITSATAE